MNSVENPIKYNAYYINVVTKDLDPIAKIVRAEGIEILTEYNNLIKIEETELKNPTGHYEARSVTAKFSVYDTEAEPFPNFNYALELLEAYPMADYAFVDFGVFVEKSVEPNNIYGNFFSFRAERGSNDVSVLIANDEKVLPPLTGKKAQYATNLIEILKDFKEQSPELTESILGKMTEAQKGYAFNFSENLCKLYSKLFIYLLKTESGLKPKVEMKSQLIKQIQPPRPENSVMLKSEIFKTVTSMKESDFDKQGRAYRRIKYPVRKNTVTTDLMVTKPVEDRLENILLFPIDPNVFQVAVMREPLNKYDGKVFKAICTILDYYINLNPEIVGKDGAIRVPITLTDIHRAMGYKGRLKETEKRRIRNSVFKLSTTQVYYNWSEEKEARHIDFTDEIKDIYGNSLMYTRDVLYMLEAEHSSYIVPKHCRKSKDGQPLAVEGFIIKAIPPVYAHAKLTKTIASVPLKWFEVKALGKMTDRRNSLLQGLTERISTSLYFKEQGKDPNKGNYNVIVLDPFFYDSGIVVNNKQTRSQLIKDLEIILNEYQKLGLIKKYTYSQKASGLYSIKFYV